MLAMGDVDAGKASTLTGFVLGGKWSVPGGVSGMEDVAQADTMVFSGVMIAIVIGAIAGWLAGKLVTGGGFGFLGNTVLGIGGAILAEWMLPLIGVSLGSGFFGSVLSAMIGAAAVLLLIRVIKRV